MPRSRPTKRGRASGAENFTRIMMKESTLQPLVSEKSRL